MSINTTNVTLTKDQIDYLIHIVDEDIRDIFQYEGADTSIKIDLFEQLKTAKKYIETANDADIDPYSTTSASSFDFLL